MAVYQIAHVLDGLRDFAEYREEMQLHEATQAEHNGAFLHIISPGFTKEDEALDEQIAFGFCALAQPLRVLIGVVAPDEIVVGVIARDLAHEAGLHH